MEFDNLQGLIPSFKSMILGFIKVMNKPLQVA